MKVKRIIKAFIYLFPFITILFNAIMLIPSPYKLSSVPDIAYPYDTINGNDFTYMIGTNRRTVFSDFLYPITSMGDTFINSDDTPLYDIYRSILDSAGIHADDTGESQYFFALILTYETYALIINVIIDVLFIVPELVYKFEDESIMSRKKKRR